MTSEIQTFLYIIGSIFIVCSIAINLTLRHYFPMDTDELKVDIKRTLRERKKMARKREKRDRLKIGLQISIPGFEDVRIKPKLEDMSDSDQDGSEDDNEKKDPESKW